MMDSSRSSTLKIAKHVDETTVAPYSITFDPTDLSPLAKAITSTGQNVDGYAAEAILVRLSEIASDGSGSGPRPPRSTNKLRTAERLPLRS
jgi:hypothetical protein